MNRVKYAKRALLSSSRLDVRLTSHKEGFSVLGALRWLVPKRLHVMRRPLGLTEITRHVLLKVSRSLGKHKTHEL